MGCDQILVGSWDQIDLEDSRQSGAGHKSYGSLAIDWVALVKRWRNADLINLKYSDIPSCHS